MIMSSVSLRVVIGEDRKLSIDVPPEIPVGEVEVTIHAAEGIHDLQERLSLRARKIEEFRRQLEQDGNLDKIRLPQPPTDDYQPMSDEDRLNWIKLPPDAKTSEQLVAEDREERF
jgi:hypothetical protein